MKFGPNTIANALKFPAKPTKFFHKGKKNGRNGGHPNNFVCYRKVAHVPKIFHIP